MIYRWCPQKWTSIKTGASSCNAVERGVSTKVDKLKEYAQINIEASKGVSTKVDRQKKGSLSASKSMNILIKEYDLTGTLYLNRIKAVCPLKWTN